MLFEIKTITDRSEKLRVMAECDGAFTISVLGRPYFSELFYKIDKYAVFIAAYTDDFAIAGYSAFYANDLVSKNAFLSLFCVRREMQRMHLGSRLMDISLKQAKENGMERMRLEVLREDEGAIAFYERCGFKRIEHMESDNIDINFFRYEKSFDQLNQSKDQKI